MITEKQLRELYSRVAQLYGRKEINVEEFKVWEDLFSQRSYGDLDSAIRRWPSDTTIEEFTQRPRGSRMPTPAELKASIESFDRQQNQREKFEACGKDGCQDGWKRVFSGVTAGGNQINPKVGAVRRCPCFYQWASSKNSQPERRSDAG